MATKAAIRNRVRFNPKEIDQALIALALAGGNATRAHNALKAQGLAIPERTLRDWRHTRHADRYHDLCQKHAADIERHQIQNLREASIYGLEVTVDAFRLTHERIVDGSIKDASAAAKNIALAMAITTDKMLVLDGRPDHINETRNVSDDLRDLARMVGITYTDSTAEPETAHVALLPESACDKGESA